MLALLGGDVGAERLGPTKGTIEGDRIDPPSEQLLRFVGQFLDDSNGKPDGRDIDEVVVPGNAKVDGPLVPGENDLAGFVHRRSNSEITGESVASTKWQHT